MLARRAPISLDAPSLAPIPVSQSTPSHNGLAQTRAAGRSIREGVMKLARRQVVQLAAAAVAAAALPGSASALDYPTRQVRVVVGYAAGGASDILARLLGQWLAEHMGQSFIIENRPGANSNLAAEIVVNSPADGYTLLVASTGAAINTSLYDKLSFNFLRDIAPVAGLSWIPNVLVVHPSIPVRSVPEFIAYAKAHPGQVSFASPGAGSAAHMSGELFKMMTGADMVHVPYRGDAPALTDLLGGQVQSMFCVLAPALEHIRAGKLRALGATSAHRLDVLPEVPAVAEFLPGYESFSWYGLYAPRNTPPEIVAALNKEINAALADPKIKARVADLGGAPLTGSPAVFGKFLADETDKWAKVVKFSGSKL
jgi:tripartite-type tricarboxylate transporter receptor subunit TctC